MQHGFLKVAAGTPYVRIADCAYNALRMKEIFYQAKEAGVKVLVLPELCLTGYTCGDLFFNDALLDAVEKALKSLSLHSMELEMLIAVGLPLRHNGKLYDCAALLYAGKILGIVPKCVLSDQDGADESRYFAPAPQQNSTIELCEQVVPFGVKQLFRCATIPEVMIGVVIGGDAWVSSAAAMELALAGANIILNLSASSEIIGKADYRRLMVKSISARLCCAYIYAEAGAGESTTDMVFSGHNLLAENGNILAESLPFSGDMPLVINDIDYKHLLHDRRRQRTLQPDKDTGNYTISDFSLRIQETGLIRYISPTPFIPYDKKELQARIETILNILAHGLKQRIEHTKCKTLVIGVSGGLDSTLALLVSVQAVQLAGGSSKDITAITMPCFGTSDRTKSNAKKLCDCLKIPCKTIDITASVRQHFKDIEHEEGQRDITFENAQARERTQVLMDIANQTGGLVVGTGDLSESALGWTTYNGDHMSMYAVNASVPKTLMRHILQYKIDTADQNDFKDVLQDILGTPVSPELLPATEQGEIAQQTEDIVGPYELHDFFLYHMVRWGASPDKILRMAIKTFSGQYKTETIRKWLHVFVKRFFSQQFKRSCMPDGPKIGTVGLSPRGDWRMPSDAANTVWMDWM